MTSLALRITILAALPALLAAACGSGDATGNPTTAPTTTAPTAPATTTTTAREDDAHSHDEDAGDHATDDDTGHDDDGDHTVLTATGVVIAVEGNLSATESVTVLLEDGTELILFPAEDATFHGGPFSHIRDHLASGEPVNVEYVVLDDGTLQVLSASDH